MTLVYLYLVVAGLADATIVRQPSLVSWKRCSDNDQAFSVPNSTVSIFPALCFVK
jgi:hypothetical protein